MASTKSSEAVNGSKEAPLNRAEEAEELLNATQTLIIPFIRAADEDSSTKHTGHGLAISGGGPRTALVEQHPPQKLEKLLANTLDIQSNPSGKDGLVSIVQQLLNYSVNTWDQGFLDKLYGSTNPIGLVSELILGVLNTNAHVYTVSPALTLIERHVTAYLASLFRLPKGKSGGISQPGGSAANASAITIARNVLYPETKTEGLGGKKFTLFTSEHGHYSLEKAAQIQGLGSKNVISVPVDRKGRMRVDKLEQLVKESKDRGETPFFVNATAGTTVLGSFDPFADISRVCHEHNLWLHVDGSWGGSVVFNDEIAFGTPNEGAYGDGRLKGAELADSITVSPHKMLGVPMTCSFLLGRDIRQFKEAMSLPAGYLFHDEDGDEEEGKEEDESTAYYDLADLTPQCGRRGDSLKFFLALQYHGTSHFSEFVKNGYDQANYLLDLLKANENFVVISPEPLPCLQVCFYFSGDGILGDVKQTSKVTESICRRLVPRGFMVDYAPGENGKFLRVVVHGETRRGTVEGLVKAIEGVAGELGY